MDVQVPTISSGVVAGAGDSRDKEGAATATTADRSTRMALIADALIARSNGKYDEAFLRRLVANVAADFEGARVQDYVKVLVIKEATDELRKLDALRPRAA
jgi:hypothetical protein